MKVSENPTAAPTASVADWPHRAQPVAPWWHTVLLIVVLIGFSALSSIRNKPAVLQSRHITRYALTIAWEWILALIVWWGLRMRHTPLRAVLGIRRSGLREWARDFGAAMVFWIIALTLLAAIGSLLRLFHVLPPEKAISAIAPQTLPQLLLWLVLCVTAGFVEEFVFRGYLLQQFASIRSSIWIGIIASSLLFGSAHGYEAIGGMIAITAYGAMFCALAVFRRSLRAGMIAHAWHDLIAGIALAILARAHHL